MTFIQGRIRASSPDEAAMKIRRKHNEYKGELRIKRVYFDDWYEYYLTLSEPSAYMNKCGGF